MKKEVYKIDENGFLIETYLGIFEENKLIGFLDDSGEFNVNIESLVTVGYPNNLIKEKWNGIEWIEGETEEEKAEREAKQLLESLKPSPEEIADAELEIKIATMLTELEVIQ